MNGPHNDIPAQTDLPPLVSVGVPTYNRPEGLRRTLRHLADQTYRNVEILVSDNCSTDPDVDLVLEEFAAADARIKVFHQVTNVGATSNFRFVLEQASGEYFMWASDDDWWDASFIQKALALMQERPSAVGCWCDVQFHAGDTGAISKPRPYGLYTDPDLSTSDAVSALLTWNFQHGWYGIYALFRTAAIADAARKHLRGQDLGWGSDVHMVTELLSRGPMLKVPEPLFHYSMRSQASAAYHLEHSPDFGSDARLNPYLAQLTEMFRTVATSERLRRREKAAFYLRFVLRVFLTSNAWVTAIRRYPSAGFYGAQIRGRRGSTLLFLLPLELAALGNRTLRAARRGASASLRPVRLARNHARRLLFALRLVRSRPRKPRVLIVEPNVCHGEVVGGLAYYLDKLGYHCQFLLSEEIGREDPLCRMEPMARAAHYTDYATIMQLVTSRLARAYDHLFFVSSFNYREMALFCETHPTLATAARSLFFVEHDLLYIDRKNGAYYPYYAEKRVLSLTNFAHDDHLLEISASYFGKVEVRKRRGAPVVFLVPGTHLRSLEYTVEAVRALLALGCDGFRFDIAGRISDEELEPLAGEGPLWEHLRLLGRVDFPTLYREVEACDYLMGPEGLEEYLDHRTSGSKQLSLGFCRPLVLREELVKNWGFSAESCVPHSGREGLVEAARRALAMNDDAYGAMVDSLDKIRAEQERASLVRLGERLAEERP